ncbi:hypothetical protein BpHYR1_026038 [Brachionus plicatilis]|uniref:Uncharacterized protein n=1 Tax=Brachionus plicatilis TaxID=10195 RepID=A0A3M7T0D9_BRAPC|nr:hypothetical protein BpHYR1_026038 [Brachionus plicatilis]
MKTIKDKYKYALKIYFYMHHRCMNHPIYYKKLLLLIGVMVIHTICYNTNKVMLNLILLKVLLALVTRQIKDTGKFNPNSNFYLKRQKLAQTIFVLRNYGALSWFQFVRFNSLTFRINWIETNLNNCILQRFCTSVTESNIDVQKKTYKADDSVTSFNLTYQKL